MTTCDEAAGRNPAVSFWREKMKVERLKAMALEPSTWRGVGGLLVALGIGSAGTVNAVIAVGMAVVSVVEVIRSEAK